ncbi:MAG: MFS transporter [Phycisphaerales bacterium]|nr:MFS transporter [Phycisphaerales bacterium]
MQVQIPAAPTQTISMRTGMIAFVFAELFVLYQLTAQTSYAPLHPMIAKEIGLTLLQSGVVSASFLISYGLFQIPGGLLLDRLGLRVLFPIGVVCSALSIYFFSRSTTMLELFMSRACLGCACSFSFAGLGMIAQRIFSPAGFAIAIGLCDSALGVGGAIGELGADYFGEHVGWRQTMLVTALIGVPLAIGCAWSLRSQLFGQIHATSNQDTNPATLTITRRIQSVLKKREVILAALIYGGTCGMVMGFGGFWNIPLQEAWGWSPRESVILNSVFFVGTAIGAPMAGILSARIDAKKLLIFGLVISILSYIFDLMFPPLWIMTNVADWPLWVDCINMFIIGFGLGTSILAFPIATRVVAPHMVGLTISIVNFSGIFFAAILQVAPSVIIQGFHDTTLIALQVGHSVFVLGMLIALAATMCLPSHTQPART